MPSDPPAHRPNVLIIQADQLRWDCLGATGNPDVRTPSLDRLAAEGVRYTNAFSTSPVCTPSRYSFLSGLWVRQHGGWTNRSTLAPGIDTFPRALRRAGYRTAAVGKMHFTPTYLDVGYDRMELAEQDGPGRYEDDYHRELAAAGLAPVSDLVDQEEEFRVRAPDSYWRSYGAERSNLPEAWHSTTWIGERALGLLEGWGGGGNLLHVSFVKPHHPFDPPEPWDTLYDPDALTTLPGWTNAVPAADAAHRQAHFDYGPLTLPILHRIKALYYGSITHLDHQVGRILDLLRARGLYDDTLILFASDHGEYLGFHHLLLKGGPMYDPLVRVPLVVKFPAGGGAGRRRGEVDGRLASLIDVAPTVLAACRLEPPAALPGVDLAPPGAGHACVFAEDCRFGTAVMARTERDKLLRGEAGSAFFDLDEDPLEMRGRSGDAARTGAAANLQEALSHWALLAALVPAYREVAAPRIPGPNVPPPDRDGRSALHAFFAAEAGKLLGGSGPQPQPDGGRPR